MTLKSSLIMCIWFLCRNFGYTIPPWKYLFLSDLRSEVGLGLVTTWMGEILMALSHTEKKMLWKMGHRVLEKKKNKVAVMKSWSVCLAIVIFKKINTLYFFLSFFFKHAIQRCWLRTSALLLLLLLSCFSRVRLCATP